MRRWLLWFWLLGVLLSVGALLAAGTRPEAVPWLSGPLSLYSEDNLGHLPLLLPLLLQALVLVALLGPDLGPYTPSRGELERLIQLKRHGGFLRRFPRIRYGAVRTERRVPSANRSTGVGLAPDTSPEEVLGRLVLLKRRGALAPHGPEAFESGQAHSQG
jgi:hypothetical protein